MSKKIILILAINAISLYCFSTVKSTVCNGNWNTGSVWKDGNLPVLNDTIIINHHLVLNTSFELNNNVLIIKNNAELFVDHDFTISSGSKIINYGRLIAPQFIFYGSLITYGSTITDDSYTDYFKLSTCTPVIISSENDTLLANTVANKYEWFKNDQILEDTLQAILVKESGYYKCRYKKNTSDTYSDFSDSYYKKITPNALNEISDKNISDFIVFPNPVTDDLFIYKNRFSSDIIIELTNIQGVVQKKLTSSESKITMNVSELIPGLYFIKMTTQNFQLIQKFIKK